jgi:hypothetical protein
MPATFIVASVMQEPIIIGSEGMRRNAASCSSSKARFCVLLSSSVGTQVHL